MEKRIKSKQNFGGEQLVWLAPSDPFWGKSEQLPSCLSYLINKATTKKKVLFDPTIYVPVYGSEDFRTARQWKNNLSGVTNYMRGIVEGFMDGNVEVLYLESELVAVVYHFSQPEKLPVSIPVGFVSTNQEMVTKVGKLLLDYIDGSSSFDKPNDCGLINSF